jgi:hypothetical protein
MISLSTSAAEPGPKAQNPAAAVAFGFKCQWLAVKSTDPRAVIAALKVANVRSAGWPLGVETAYDIKSGSWFVTPPVDGWVLVVGNTLPGLDGKQNPALSLAEKLSATLKTRVQYFGTHRVVEYHAWVLASEGKVARAFAWSGESGATLVNVGARTQDENELLGKRDPDETDVMKLAARWSINPQTFAASRVVGTGWLVDAK